MVVYKGKLFTFYPVGFYNNYKYLFSNVRKHLIVNNIIMHTRINKNCVS